jgi:hypothetical protein
MFNDILQLGLDFSLLDSAPDATKFQGVALYDNDFSKLVFRFLLNFTMIFLIARALYYPATKRKDYLFSFILTSMVIFFICFALKKFEIKTGMALGLFAIFGIIRFRTTTMPVKEMTYLFVIVGLSVINALTSSKFSYAELAFVNVAVMLAILAVEKVSLIKPESQKLVIYEKIDLIDPSRNAELMADLSQRTGLKISRIEIGKINFLNDTAQISVFFYQHEQPALSFHKDERQEPTF